MSIELCSPPRYFTSSFKLAAPGLLFHHVTPARDYIFDFIEPWVHYIPVREDLRDLKSKMEWAINNPEQAKKIARQGSELARYLSTPEGFEQMYRHSYVDPIRSVIDAYQPFGRRQHDIASWREVLEHETEDFYPVINRMSRFEGVNFSCIRQILSFLEEKTTSRHSYS